MISGGGGSGSGRGGSGGGDGSSGDGIGGRGTLSGAGAGSLSNGGKIIDGGPAFPESGLSGLPNGEFIHGRSGMSLRNYFAAHVDISDFKPMAVMELKHGFGKVTVAHLADYIAELRFMLADAMIKEGSKP